jgi:taurine dioxygenase
MCRSAFEEETMDGATATTSAPYEVITVQPYSPTVGAVVGNIDLTRPLTEIELAEVKQALLEHGALFFRDQKISFEDQARLGEYFGSLGAHVGKKTNSQATKDPRVRMMHADGEQPRVSGNFWHSDQPCAAIPPKVSILYLHTVPTNGGGDTGFASMYAAYDGLSERMKKYLEGLTAMNDGTGVFGPGTVSTVHPVIARHPETGRKLIFVSRPFTTRIMELEQEESEAILRYLFDHVCRSEWTTRFKWEPHSVAMWDNRCTQHRAISDYLPQKRSGYRVQVEGEEPPVLA